MASLRQLRTEGPVRYGVDDYQAWIKLANASFPVQTSGLLGSEPLPSGDDFSSIYKTNGVVFACMAIRQRVFSQITFRFASVNNGKVGKLFGGPEIDILNKPWKNGTSGDLASRAILDADTKGAFFGVREGDTIYRRDPMHMSVVLSGDPAVDEFVDIMGYVYRPKGKQGPTFTYTPSQVCHWTPVLDPDASYTKGMSWITPILREIRSDNSATEHKAQFFTNGATPNMVVKFPEGVMSQEQFDRFKAKMESEYAGSRGAGKTLYLAPGADVEVVGKDFKEMDFSETQGRDETRIASAAGVAPVLVGLKESLAGSSLNQGNYQAARRAFADGTMSDLYRGFAAALETIVPAPQIKGPAKLWFDISQVPFFREDRADAANIQFTRAQAMRQCVDSGWTPESVLAAFEAEDMSLLVHSGMYSVQLQPAGTPAAATRAKRDQEQRDGAPLALPALHVHTHNEVGATPIEVRAEFAQPEVHNHIEVQPADVIVERSDAPIVQVNVPDQPAPNVTVVNEVSPTPVTVRNDVTVKPADTTVLPTQPVRRKVVRNSKGEIIEVIED